MRTIILRDPHIPGAVGRREVSFPSCLHGRGWSGPLLTVKAAFIITSLSVCFQKVHGGHDDSTLTVPDGPLSVAKE